MAQGKKSFVAYSDWKDTFDALPDDVAGQLIKHIFAYVNDENPKADFIVTAVFANIKNTLKRDLDKWENQLEQRSRAGKASAAARAKKFNERSNSLNEIQRNPTVSVNDSVSVNDNVILLKKETKIYSVPSFEEFLKYALEKEKTVKQSALKNKYDAWIANDWRDGNDRSIKNWKSKLLQTMPYIEKNVNQARNGLSAHNRPLS